MIPDNRTLHQEAARALDEATADWDFQLEPEHLYPMAGAVLGVVRQAIRDLPVEPWGRDPAGWGERMKLDVLALFPEEQQRGEQEEQP